MVVWSPQARFKPVDKTKPISSSAWFRVDHFWDRTTTGFATEPSFNSCSHFREYSAELFTCP